MYSGAGVVSSQRSKERERERGRRFRGALAVTGAVSTDGAGGREGGTTTAARVTATPASRVRHSVAIFGQRLMVCDQSMREKAWRSRKRGA